MRATNDIIMAARKNADRNEPLTTEQKNNALILMAEELTSAQNEILAANLEDLEAVKGKISDVMTDRLRLDVNRIKGMAKGLEDVAKLPDPVNNVLTSYINDDGLRIEKISVPIGVVAIIYESRPNVTSDAAALALKSGNTCILRGGKEAMRTSLAVVKALKAGLKRADIPEDYINIIEDTSRDSANELMRAQGLVDLLIPRGGAGLIKACVDNAKVPCIQTGTGICHIYVDASANIAKALKITENAKMSRPSVCNAAEVLLVHKDIADEFLPLLRDRLTAADREHKAELRLDPKAAGIIDGTPAGADDFDTEFLDYIMAVKVVDDVNEAVAHISAHSTHHSEAVIAEDVSVQKIFTSKIDSAAVYVNASTRFTDGGVFGLGCEMGISTQKLHARGPMGLNELTAYKYVITGNGNVRE